MNNLGGQLNGVVGQMITQPNQMQAQVVGQAPVQAGSTIQPNQQGIQGMFTQEQLNSIISNRINPLNQRIQDLSNQLAQAQQLSQSYLSELTSMKNRESAINAGVPAQFLDFAIFEANKLAVNGKSFDDAIKEYVATNGQLFGVSQMDNQAQQAVNTPTVMQATQGVANPAQVIQAQQSSPNNMVVGNNQVVPSNQVMASGDAGVSIQASQQASVVTPNSTPVMNQVPVSNQVPVQYGATSIQNAGNPVDTNNVNSQVEAFLKARGLK